MSDELRPLPELVSFIELAPEPHILFDRDYRVIAANKAYRSQFGGNRSVIGRTCYDVSHHYSVPCDRAGEACPLARSLESEQRERVLHLHQTPRGEEYVNIELTPVRNGSGDIAWFIEKMEPLKVARGVSDRSGLIGRAPAFQRMLELVARVAPSDASVLLQGESGSGKELVAQAVHDASRRADRAFVAVDCSGLQDTLFESELFGHEKGAFTGAIARKAGLVEAASGGTLFLDELGDIPLTMQVKLLRLLETGTYRRVGSTELMRADIRLVSATHRPLKQMIAEGRFRQDLYYRLNAFPIVVPPLRERREDLPLLVESLLARVAPGRRLTVSPSAMRALQAHAFPGNVRELRNVLERASLLCDGEEIGTQHLDEEVRVGCTGPARRNATDGQPVEGEAAVDLEEAQRQMLARVVRNHTGSRHELARKLGISERTLYRRLRALGIAQD
ncbi:sigma-54-dependent Fis family transcriptional regulator [Methyloversatilis sp.]|uniref:sigma-54 interaction domain-containing protein n=1 Tax=Methyloversatilis sp. TaxID=2569862 RepID=UPI00273405A0|nr:sigma 54-interacting transcriptional regulator [Methyloversatilis sp.]MDP2869575.1 sigma 54-interacting transcriptional regulator [Methyloversatilis sp.]MDP3456136.1 sigma 54-interacting transcriptional regulator [Methyloversatilis sp.]MDP3577389.1 sigma 54-interacting transcriptional regulator [Methyloversatilis sp.]